jgi:hypothetical protein
MELTLLSVPTECAQCCALPVAGLGAMPHLTVFCAPLRARLHPDRRSWAIFSYAIADAPAVHRAPADLIPNADLMWKQSVWTSMVSAQVAAKFLAE